MNSDSLEKGDAHWVVEYVKHGEPAKSGFLHMTLAFYLHWRTWGLAWAVGLPYLVALVVYDAWGGYWGLLVGIFVAHITGGWALKVGTKYDVTKNY